ncbi:MAG TPA: CHC2 zinc finger domain-containing protein, partial [Thermoanaerobaculia bacterium]|nr:CHC2 zinc finger domain-containing protein [Thermoanaerobaculia bacterium]
MDRDEPAAKHLRRPAHPLLSPALPVMTPDGAQLAVIERALAARQARREGRELRFLCPAHEDRRPSARWNRDKQTWFCDVCQAGGGWRDLAARLGLELPAAAGGELLAEVEAVYDYRDGDGRLLYQVLRKRGKAFACRRPLPGSGWAWNLEGVERVLYRLPELAAAM